MKPHLVALAFGLILMSAGNAMVQTGCGTESCGTGHRFEPGPIVNGHHRQPTPGEIKARTQQLRAWNEVSVGSCLAVTVPRGNVTATSGPPDASSPDRVVELDPPPSQRMR
jgi:hypothetical protein